jgi:ATP-dependent RNA helicase DDX54/DBP10
MPEKRIDKTSIRNSQPQLQTFGLFNMPHRAASPAASENEFDITSLLFKDDIDAEDDDFGFSTSKDLGNLDAGGIIDLANESDGDGDEAFIAAQQAASNRKASNLKGKSVKKGGGFQAMGIDEPKPSMKKRLILVKD